MSRSAFSLIELLVVIAIIGLLSAVAAAGMESSRVKARNARRKADLVQISKALELYYSDNGRYPSTVGMSGCVTFNGAYMCGNCAAYGGFPNTDSPTSWIPGLVSGGYVSVLPKDPNSGKANPSSPSANCRNNAINNCYFYASNGNNYAVFAYCTPEGGAVPSTDPFFVPGTSGIEYKLTNDWAATAGWY